MCEEMEYLEENGGKDYGLVLGRRVMRDIKPHAFSVAKEHTDGISQGV